LTEKGPRDWPSEGAPRSAVQGPRRGDLFFSARDDGRVLHVGLVAESGDLLLAGGWRARRGGTGVPAGAPDCGRTPL